MAAVGRVLLPPPNPGIPAPASEVVGSVRIAEDAFGRATPDVAALLRAKLGEMAEAGVVTMAPSLPAVAPAGQ